MPPSVQTPPIRVAVVNDYDLVVAGVAQVLAPYPNRLAVVELDASREVVSAVDVVLYDTFGQVEGEGVGLRRLVQTSGARVVVFSWNVQPDLVDRALEIGARGYVSKAMTAEMIVEAIERVARGDVVVPTAEDTDPEEDRRGNWPGRSAGLTAREAEVLALIAQGLTNQQIADQSYLSINSVKTYIRSGYRKIGVASRSQAVGWALRHGFDTDTSRLVVAPQPR